MITALIVGGMYAVAIVIFFALLFRPHKPGVMYFDGTVVREATPEFAAYLEEAYQVFRESGLSETQFSLYSMYLETTFRHNRTPREAAFHAMQAADEDEIFGIQGLTGVQYMADIYPYCAQCGRRHHINEEHVENAAGFGQ